MRRCLQSSPTPLTCPAHLPHPPALPTYGCFVVAHKVDVVQQKTTHSQCKADDEEEEEQSVESRPVDRELVLPCRFVAGRCCKVVL